MKSKTKYFVFIFFIVIILIVISAIFISSQQTSGKLNININNFSRKGFGIITEEFDTPTLMAPVPSDTPKPSLTPNPSPSEAPIDYTARFVNTPQELMEEDIATFTWLINGPATTIKTTTVYMGTTSSGGLFTHNTLPTDTFYTSRLKDFLEGRYDIPLQFVGSERINTPGTYFARAYALIDGKNYWSDERIFYVNKKPRNEIKIVDSPAKISLGGNATFTWEIIGPGQTTGYTIIIGGKESKPGNLDETVDIPHTPYTTILVKDFTNGSYNVPLRFVGNAIIRESGIYFFRAFTSINNKNIWSDEQSFTVK